MSRQTPCGGQHILTWERRTGGAAQLPRPCSSVHTAEHEPAALSLLSSPKPLKCPGADLRNVRFLQTVEDANQILELAAGKRLVIVGASFIGADGRDGDGPWGRPRWWSPALPWPQLWGGFARERPRWQLQPGSTRAGPSAQPCPGLWGEPKWLEER